MEEVSEGPAPNPSNTSSGPRVDDFTRCLARDELDFDPACDDFDDDVKAIGFFLPSSSFSLVDLDDELEFDTARDVFPLGDDVKVVAFFLRGTFSLYALPIFPVAVIAVGVRVRVSVSKFADRRVSKGFFCEEGVVGYG
jgi:hypothetical protein